MGQEHEIAEFSLAVSGHGQQRVVRIAGDVDLYTAPVLEERLSALVDDGAIEIVVDLADVEFMDSTGVRALLRTLGHLRDHDGSMVLRSTTGTVRKTLELTGTDRSLAMTGSA